MVDVFDQVEAQLKRERRLKQGLPVWLVVVAIVAFAVIGLLARVYLPTLGVEAQARRDAAYDRAYEDALRNQRQAKEDSRS